MSDPVQRWKRVIVTGGRDYDQGVHVFSVLNGLSDQGHSLFVIQGGCPSGADLWARQWCDTHGYPLATVPAHWKRHGRSAGPLRNQWMLALDPDLVIAFPGGAGTRSMVKEAQRVGIDVRLEEPWDLLPSAPSYQR